MAAIPQVDLTVPLHDTGYSFNATEADTSHTIGRFGFVAPSQFPSGLGGYSQVFNQATNDGYNTLNGAMTAIPANFELSPAAKIPHAAVNLGALPGNWLSAFDGTNFLQLTWNNAGAGSTISVRIQTWPGPIDYDPASWVNLPITNPQAFSFGGVYPVTFHDGSPGFILWGVSLAGFIHELLPITLNLAAPTTFVADPRNVPGGPTISYPSQGVNYQADASNLPTMQVWTQDYDLSSGSLVVTTDPGTQGDISTDASNALAANLFGNFSWFYIPKGPGHTAAIFGIDWATGNNTGCWYMALDCSQFGRFGFTMPDASLGPSSDPTVYWVYAFNNFAPPGNSGNFWYYPSWDLAGNIYWLRVPLTDGLGNYVLEALTGEVYSSLGSVAAPGRFFGTSVGIWQGGAGGGTK